MDDEQTEALPPTAEDDRSTGTDRYFVDLDSGMVHTKDVHGRSFEADNLDKSTHLVEVPSREQINVVLGDRRAKACKRCFPEPTTIERAAADSAEPRQGTRAQARAGKTGPGPSMTDEEYEAIDAAGTPPMTDEDEAIAGG